MLLAHMQAYQPLPGDMPSPQVQTRANVDAPPPALSAEWVPHDEKATPMLYNAQLNMFRCASPGCDFTRPTMHGVACHYSRFCTLNPISSRSKQAINVDGGGDEAEDDVEDVTEE